MKLERHLPVIAALRSATSASLRDDAVAGLTTAVMLIPQGMAYAMLAGLEPIVGLYASTVPIVLYGLLGTSRQLAVGPVAMVSLLVASGVGGVVAEGDPAAYVAAASLLALMVGALQLAMGLARLGFLVKFLSHPVIAGFTSAAALIIASSQLDHVLADELTLLIGVATLAALVALKRVAPRFPRFLLVVVVGTLAVWGLGLDVAIVGDVPSGLPSLALPSMEWGLVRELLPTAVTISLVAFMESIAVAKGFAKTGGYALDADQELKALGVANLGGAVVGAYPVTGGFSRTAVNAQAGATSGLAGLVTAAAVALTLLFLTPLFHFLPKAVLAAIILSAVLGLVDVAEAKHLWKVSRSDLALMALTFAATLGLGIEEGILVGVGASLVWFVWQTSKPHVAVLGRLPGTSVYRNVLRNPDAVTTPGVLAVRVDAPLFFANTAFLKHTLREHEGEELHTVVLDAKGIGSVDASGEALLAELIADWQGRGIEVWIAGMRGPVRDIVAASGLLSRLDGRLVHRVHEALAHEGAAA